MSEVQFDLERIKIDKILFGNIIWHKRSGKTVVGHCGDYANYELLSRLFLKGSSLSVESFVNEELVKKQIMLFEKLKNAELEVERIEIRSDIVQDFSDVFINQVSDGSFIDWWLVCHRSFYDLPKELEDYITINSVSLYKRAVGLASLTTLLALSYGYMNYNFLKMIYNSMFICDLEVLKPGNFRQYYFDKLEQSRDVTIVNSLSEFFIENEPEIKEFLKQCGIENDLIFQLIKFHHERPESGLGPHGLYESEMNDLVEVATLSYRLVSLDDVILSFNDAKGFLARNFKELERYRKLKKLFEIEFKSVG